MARISLESGAPAPEPKASKAAKSGASKSAAPGKGSLDSAAKKKLIIAVVIFVVGGLAISWNLFLSDMFNSSSAELTAKDVWQGGNAPTPEQEQQNAVLKKKQDEQIKGFEKKYGGGGS